MIAAQEITNPHPFRDPRVVLGPAWLAAAPLADDDRDLPPLAWICPECGAVQATNPPCRECGADPWPIDDDEAAVAALADAPPALAAAA
jgi:hypothetical protein